MSMSRLAADYLAGRAELAPFFAHAPHLDALDIQAGASMDAGLVAEINAAQARIGGSGRLEPDDLTIVTGQQPGIFTGPLYTIYKAITAIRLAEEVAARTGRRCKPVFWVAADDHDFDEVRTAHVLTKQHALLPLTYAPEADVAGLPMGAVPLEPSIHALIDTAAAQTVGSEFRDDVAATLHDTCDAADSVADWFARLMARLFRDTPLVIFTPALPAARRVAAPVFARAITDPLAATARANEAGARLAALGYPPQVAKADDECAFFLVVDGRRRKVVWRDGAFVLPEIGDTLSADAMARRLAECPGEFSANVLLRGVAQQSLFPGTLAYVGGPGEIAYWAQLRGVFGHFDTPMPAVLPRASAVITSTKLRKIATKQGLTIADLDAPVEALIDRVLASGADLPFLRDTADHCARISAEAMALAQRIGAAKEADANARAVADRFAEQTCLGLDRLLRALRRADTARVDTARQQIERLATALMPLRKPQERVLCVFSFLFEHGWDLIPRLAREIDPHRHDGQEIEL